MHHLVVNKAVRARLREFGLNITALRGTEVKGLGTAHAVVKQKRALLVHAVELCADDMEAHALVGAGGKYPETYRLTCANTNWVGEILVGVAVELVDIGILGHGLVGVGGRPRPSSFPTAPEEPRGRHQ